MWGLRSFAMSPSRVSPPVPPSKTIAGTRRARPASSGRQRVPAIVSPGSGSKLSGTSCTVALQRDVVRVHNRHSGREPQGARREGDAMYTRRHSLAIALLSAAAIVAGACGPTGPTGGTAATGTAAASKAPVPSMRVAILADEGTLTPFSYKFGYPGQQMMYLTYDTLMLLDAENLPKPLLAREVKTSADGATYDVTLRTGVKWHDGKPLTNEDVKFSFEYILKTTRAAFRTPIRTVESITLTGTEGLSIKLTTPNPSFPVRALAAVPILPKHIWESVDPAKSGEFKATIGSGPYKLTEATPDTVYR